MCGIGRNEMRSILTWLDPSADPRITIGVGSPSLVPAKRDVVTHLPHGAMS